MIRFGPVPVDFFDIVWPHISQYVEALDRRTNGAVTADLIRRRVALGHWMLWVALDGDEVLGFLLTEMSDDHRKTVCMINLAGRDLARWERIGIEAVEDWARSEGATHMTGICRDGLVRRMSKYGYGKISNVIEKGLV